MTNTALFSSYQRNSRLCASKMEPFFPRVCCTGLFGKPAFSGYHAEQYAVRVSPRMLSQLFTESGCQPVENKNGLH